MKRLHEWIKKFPVKKALTAIYVLAWVVGLGMIGASVFWLIPADHRAFAMTAMCAVAIVILMFRSYEEYRAAQRAEDLYRIKQAIRDTMREMQNPK